MKNIDYICRLSQRNLKKYVTRELKNIGYETVISKDGFVFAKGDFPVLICAHMDTVHSSVPSKIYTHRSNLGTVLSAKGGIGGDDRCGVYMVLKVAARKKCSVLFLEDEEIGCVGADKFVESKTSDDLKFNYIIEFDRKGKQDAVFYECDNPEFTDFITKEYYKEDYGSMSDISVLAPALGCAAVNLSCGYYNQHTKNEYIVLEEMEQGIEEAIKILDRTDVEKDVFEYMECEYDGWGYDDYMGVYSGRLGGKLSHFGVNGYGSRYNSGLLSNTSRNYLGGSVDKQYSILYYDNCGVDREFHVFAGNIAEALGNLMLEEPKVCYDDVYDYYVSNI